MNFLCFQGTGRLGVLRIHTEEGSHGRGQIDWGVVLHLRELLGVLINVMTGEPTRHRGLWERGKRLGVILSCLDANG